jgi:hypothetical protein
VCDELEARLHVAFFTRVTELSDHVRHETVVIDVVLHERKTARDEYEALAKAMGVDKPEWWRETR